MGKVVSKVVQVVTEVVSTRFGATAVLILSGVLLGPFGVVGAAAIQKSATDQKIIQLKEQIKKFIDAHKAQIKQAEQLSEILQKNFFNHEVFDGITNLGQQVKGNMNTLFQEQKQKIEALQNINWAHGMKSPNFNTADDKSRMLTDNLINLGRAALDIIAIVSGISSGNLLSIGLGVFDLAMMTYSNIKGIFENIEKINQLEENRRDIQQYFRPGGQFQNHMRFTVEYTVDIVSNLCNIAIYWNSLINQIRAWIQMLKIMMLGAQTDIFNNFIIELNKSPIDESVLLNIVDLQRKVIVISQNQNGSIVKVHELFTLLNKFESDHHVQNIFDKIKYLLKVFSADSIAYLSLKNYIGSFKDITFLINQNAHLFKKIPNESLQQTTQRHKEILQIIKPRVKVSEKLALSQASSQKMKRLKIVTIVSACTDKFYATDPSGESLFGQKLEPYVKNRGLVKFLDSTTSSTSANIIALPRPLPNFPIQVTKYQRTLKYLYDKLQYAKQGNHQPIDQIQKKFSLCMCLKTIVYQVQNQMANRAVLYKRIQHNQKPNLYYQQLNESVEKNIAPINVIQQPQSGFLLLTHNSSFSAFDSINNESDGIIVATSENVKDLLKDGAQWIRVNLRLDVIANIRIKFNQNSLMHQLSISKQYPSQVNYRNIVFTQPLNKSYASQLKANKQNYILSEIEKPDDQEKRHILWILIP